MVNQEDRFWGKGTLPVGDPLECNPANSSSSVSYEDASLGISIDPSAQVSLATPDVDLTQVGAPRSSSGDSYSVSLRLPSHLSPSAHIRVSDGNGGARDVQLSDLIRESRTDASARANLKTLASAAASIPGILDRCYVGSEENLLPMLAQLGSSDSVARHEGALSLQDFIQHHPQDRALQQGLVATVADIARQDTNNTEARSLLTAIARDNCPQNAGLRQWMQRQPDIAPLTPSANAVAQSNSGSNPTAPAPLALSEAVSGTGGSGPAAVQTTTALLANTAANAPAALLAPAVSDRLISLIETRTAGTPLDGIPTEGILNFAQNQGALPAGQFEDLLRLRILADALPLNGFTGNLFGAASTVAGLLAEDIRRGLNRDSVQVRSNAIASNGAFHSDGWNASDSAPVLSTSAHPVLPNANAPVDGTRAMIATTFPTFAANFFVPSLLTSLSGMQGLTSQSNGVVSTPLATLAFGLGGHSSYHVEGPTSLDEGGHQGFGGGSSGNGSGQEGGDHHDERREGADAYLA